MSIWNILKCRKLLMMMQLNIQKQMRIPESKNIQTD